MDFKMTTLVCLLFSGMAPTNLATDSQLVSDEGCRAFCHIKDVRWDLQQLWREVFCSCRSAETVEQHSSWSATNRH